MDVFACFQKSAFNVDLGDLWFWISIGSIAFNPTFWNTVARREHRTRFMTRMFGGNKYYACYAMAVIIEALGLVRYLAYKTAMDYQPKAACMEILPIQLLGYACFIVGNILVLSSFFALGITGTFLGDYFDILMEARVASFPFSVNDNPMYNGTVLMSLGTALLSKSPTGILLSGVVYAVYRVALEFEGPFTSEIYGRRDQARKTAKKEL
ncbi:Phosphatidyl-N-methylethanolamine N-methyltransferase [Podila epicladia]|nr:Phosphatidyl-N-methylethanolamine N-methyltransferase [Podila epicladia]KAG0092213.1 Phosphatidyl-N-methylethanolamine N-methyltransferase [Podila epicladia]